MAKKPEQAAAPQEGAVPANPNPWAPKPGETQTPPVNEADNGEIKPEATPPATPEATAETKPEISSEEIPATVPAEAEVVHEGEVLDMVTVTVPKAFNLRLDHLTVIAVKAGTQQMERAHAEHWYSKANGVEIYNPK